MLPHHDMQKYPGSVNIYIFAKTSIDSMSMKTRYSILNEMTKNIKLISKPSINQTHREKRIAWTEKILENKFQAGSIHR